MRLEQKAREIGHVGAAHSRALDDLLVHRQTKKLSQIFGKYERECISHCLRLSHRMAAIDSVERRVRENDHGRFVRCENDVDQKIQDLLVYDALYDACRGVVIVFALSSPIVFLPLIAGWATDLNSVEAVEPVVDQNPPVPGAAPGFA